MLDTEDRRILLDLAESTIRQFLARRTVPEPIISAPALLAARGAFVSLHLGRKLRGCIGCVEARHPLWKAVRDMAVEAAVEDPRFSPLTAEEFARIDLEISALTPPTPIASPGEIEVGRDGLIVRHQGRSGLLLPQVAVEWKWDRDQFLSQTCVKADLPPDAWKTGAAVLRFSAEVFGRVVGTGAVEDRDPTSRRE